MPFPVIFPWTFDDYKYVLVIATKLLNRSIVTKLLKRSTTLRVK